MAHKHSVYDTDPHFQIDGVTRVVKNASNTKTTLVQYDHNSERFTFEIPRMVDGHDMKLANQVQVHYINIDSSDRTGQTKSSGVYEVNDLQTSPNGDDVVICSWLISRNATKYVGNLSFTIRFACIADDGTEDYAWNTAIHSAVYVSAGIYNGEEVTDEEAYVDIIAQWKADLFGVGDTEEQRLLDVSAQQQAAIEAKGATVLATIPDEYEELSNKVNEHYGKTASSIVCNVGGERISVSDASDDGVCGLKLFGKPEQITTTGAQKLPYPYTQATRTTNGITFTDNGDGSITISGTATGNAYLDLYNAPSPEIPGSHFLSGVNSGKGYKMYAYTGGAYKEDTGKGVLLENGVTSVHITVATGTTVNDTVYPMLSEGSTALPWERYSGGAPSPSTDYPQELESVGSDGNIGVTVLGKNLCPAVKAGAYNGNTGAFLPQYPNDRCTEKIPIVKGQSYAQSNNLGMLPTNIFLWNADGTYIGKAPKNNTYVAEYDGYIAFEYGENDVQWVQLELGDTATPYEPYKEQTLTAQTPNGLHGIDEVRDEIDFANGVRVQRFATVVFDGVSEGRCATGRGQSSTEKYAYVVPTATWGRRVGRDVIAVCSHYVFSGVAADSNKVANNNFQLCYASGSTTTSKPGSAYFGHNSLSTVEEYNVFLAEQYAAGTPVTVMYELATPIETPLSAEELAQYAALHTNKPNTTVYNDAGAYMEMEYNADTKLYIDNKFAELAAMIAASTAQSTAQIAE